MQPTTELSSSHTFEPGALIPVGGEPTRSPAIAQLASALAKAQGAMPIADRNADNQDFGSRYADLASVWSACRAALSANELCVVQQVANTDKGVLVTSTLFHSSGEWISNRLEVGVTRRDAQAIGSAITYGRRYSLAALVGVAAGEDDDGAAASTPAAKAAAAARQQATAKRSEKTGTRADSAVKAARERGWALMTEVKKTGATKKEFLVWAAQVLGTNKDMTTWTLEEVEALEKAHANGRTEAA